MTLIQRVVITAGIGSMLEMYDFVVYGLVGAILGQLFFPAGNDFVSIMASFAVFASGFLARPAGSLLFGHFGDRIGRKTVLIITIILMALSSFLIAMMPTYQTIGLWAPLLLIMLRMLQGLAVGGEFSGAVTFVAEHAEQNHRGFMTSWIFFFVNMGVVLASAIAAFFSGILSSTAFAQWGWRILFLIGGLLAIIGFYLRQKISETPTFMRAQRHHKLVKYPLLDIFSTQGSSVIKGIGISLAISVFVGMIVMFMPTYLTTFLQVPFSESLLLNTVNVLILSFLIPMVGLLSDHVGRKRLLLFGTSGLTFLSYPLFILLNHANLLFKFGALVGFDVFGASILGVFGAVLTELFPTRSRYTCVAFSYNVPFALFAGTAPIISIYLMHHTTSTISPSFYLIASAAISLLLIFSIKETVNQAL